VIVLDANILLYAYGAASPRHKEARAWLEEVLSSAEPVGLPWQTLAAFIRIVTNPRLPGFRRSTEEASRAVDEWLEQPNVRVLVPGDQHWSQFRRMIIEGQASGPLVRDAHLAALTIEYGGVLYTADRDFARFPGLRWTNPLS
jgi:toxin-antitoxin system PIN domain toxin